MTAGGLPELGPESPAVVNLLVHHGHVTGDALPATVIDLAERGYLSLEEIGPRRFVCRLDTRGDDGPLDDHERVVLQLLRDRARGGTVPTEALTTGVDDESSAWWQQFRNHVVTAARDSGVVRRINYGNALAIVVVAIAAILVGVATHAPRHSAFARFAIAAALGIAVVAAAVDGVWTDRLRFTSAGRAAAHRWCRACDAMRGGRFSDLPPPAVTIWDRYFAYAAACGLAPDACRGLPMGPDSTRHAWRHTPGGWERIRLRYPRRMPPGWGRHPLVCVAAGFFVAAVSTALITSALGKNAWHPSPPFSDWVADIIRDAQPAIVGVAIAAFVWSAWVFGSGLYDLVARPVEIDGRVIGRWVQHATSRNPWGDLIPRNFYLAVDDDTSDVVRGWRVAQRRFREFRLGDDVHVVVTPLLRHVRVMEGVSGSSAPGDGAASDRARRRARR